MGKLGPCSSRAILRLWGILIIGLHFPRETQRPYHFSICWVFHVHSEVHWLNKVGTLRTEGDQETECSLDAPHYCLPSLQSHWKWERAIEIPGIQHRFGKKKMEGLGSQFKLLYSQFESEGKWKPC